MNVADNTDAKQARINHGLEVVRHARFRSSQTESATRQILFGRQHVHKFQSHWIAERLKHLR